MLGYVLVASAAVLWGCWSLFLRPAGLEGPQSAFILFVVMGLPGLLSIRREAFRDRAAVKALLALGIADAANGVLFFSAYQRGPVAIAVLTHYFAPLLVAALAPLVLEEPRSRRAWTAIPLSLFGLAMLLGMPDERFPLVTALYGGGSAIFYAAVVLSAKRAAKAFTPFEVNSLHSLVSAAILLGAYRGEVLPGALEPALWVIAGSILCGTAGGLLFNVGLRRIPAPVTGALTYLEPLTATVVGYLAFGESLGPWALLGGALIIGSGAYMVFEPPPVDTRQPAAPS